MSRPLQQAHDICRWHLASMGWWCRKRTLKRGQRDLKLNLFWSCLCVLTPPRFDHVIVIVRKSQPAPRSANQTMSHDMWQSRLRWRGSSKCLNMIYIVSQIRKIIKWCYLTLYLAGDNVIRGGYQQIECQERNFFDFYLILGLHDTFSCQKIQMVSCIIYGCINLNINVEANITVEWKQIKV